MRTITRLCFFILSAISAWSQSLPAIPDSDRVLTQKEVKNFWINSQENIRSRQALISKIQKGEFDLRAKIVMLQHNIATYRTRGDEKTAASLEERLVDVEAVLATLELERANAERLERLIAATERLAKAIEESGGTTKVVEVIENDTTAYEKSIIRLQHEMLRLKRAACQTPRQPDVTKPPKVIPYTTKPTSPKRPQVRPTPSRPAPAPAKQVSKTPQFRKMGR